METSQRLLNHFLKGSAYYCLGPQILERCPAGTGVNSLGKCNHIGSILFAMEDFNRKGLKEFNEPLTCTSKLSKWNVPRDSSSAPAPIDQVLIKKN